MLNFLYLKLVRNTKIKDSVLYYARIKASKENFFSITNSKLKIVKLVVSGFKNKIELNSASCIKVSINIKGSNNLISLEKGVVLRNANIIIRGSENKLIIGEGTTFGSVRIVNVGFQNDIIIGRNCLFSDNIEIWASDTHSIYDSNGKFINEEKPITIRDNVWIGSHVKILKGVQIGSGSVVGMGGLVVKNIDENTLNVGVPTRAVKKNVSWKLNYPNEKSITRI